MDKIFLNWNSFEKNIREYFRKLRKDNRLFDVTLVTEDGHHIQAHKIILSAGSHFFNDIFQKTNHAAMLIYLKGISSDKLEPVIDFMYNGETLIAKEELEVFTCIWKELKVRGLEGELTELSENMDGQENIYNGNLESVNEYANSEGDTVEKELVPDLTDAKITKSIVGISDENMELSPQINQIIEKNEGKWKCRLCGKISQNIHVITRHAETHIDGLSYACRFCPKIFQSKNGLNSHICAIHSDSFSCNICQKSGLNRQAIYNHKRRHH